MNTGDLQPEQGHEPPDSDMLAAEYALGLPDAASRRELQARIARDAGFAARVGAWERHLAGLLDEIDPAAVPADVWPRIQRRLGWHVPERPRRPWQSVGFWQGMAALASAAAIATIFFVRMPPPAAPPPIVAQRSAAIPEPSRPVTTLAHEDGAPAWLATIDAGSGLVRVVPVPAPEDARGRVHELWLIPAGAAPRSLGLVATAHAQTIVVTDALRSALAAGSTLAVSLEPRGGAPHGAPTGPIVAQGLIEEI